MAQAAGMIINFGSINIDHVYQVDHMPKPGETLFSRGYDKFLGGKGMNQSIAVAQARGKLIHVGAVGTDGQWALDEIRGLGVSLDHIITLSDKPTGHAIISIDRKGENQIVIEGGANQSFTSSMIENSLKNNSGNGWVLLQNETNLAREIVQAAKEYKIPVAYAAAPFDAETVLSLISKIDLLVVNQGEAEALSRTLGVPLEEIPVSQLLVTLGEDGARFYKNNERFDQKAFQVEAKDTTGAGDTFLGSFLAMHDMGCTLAEALEYAAAASAIQVTRHGAATAIPSREEVTSFLHERKSG